MCAHPSDPGGDILDLAHLPVEEEAEVKRLRVERALAAMGIRAEVPAPPPPPVREGARARIRLHVGRGGRLVMFRRRTHETVSPPLDRMARPRVATAARGLEEGLSALPEMEGGQVEVRADAHHAVAVLYPLAARRIRQAADLARPMGPAGAVALRDRAVVGDPRVEFRVAGLALRFGPVTFFQVHPEANDRLVADVVARILALGPARVLDLFGGAGNFSLPLAAAGTQVELVEASGPAVSDARQNAARLGLDVQVVRWDATRFDPGRSFFDVAVLDPPRSGGGETLARVLVTRPRAVVLVSCHPPSLARDLRVASDRGYRVEDLRLHDLFPLTSHVEVVATLRR
ncbi:MAG: class I SAM-dependent RNA methyltransferase [Deltaproteobacteria bacterium]|nr:class I SAM-dependent RNA methyltransferase [Deltaproteobacteria bacterium]